MSAFSGWRVVRSMSNDQWPNQPPNGTGVSWEQLDRYWAGECSPEESVRIAQILARDPAHAAAADAYLQRAAGMPAPRLDMAESWARMRINIEGPERGRLASPSTRRQPGRGVWTRFRSRPVIAGIGLAMMAVVAVMLLPRRGSEWRLGIEADPTHPTARYATAMGQTAMITLLDGTRVTLAPHSTLSVPTQFGAFTRTVVLQGEAYFAVNRSTTIPFQVQTGAVTTRVLGTAFDVRRYADDRETQVAVTTGKVVVAASTVARPSLTLVAGTVGTITDSTAAMTSTDSAARYTAWTSGMLVFHDVAATEILAALRRWYGYEFRVMDSTVVEQVVTAAFSTRSSAEALSNLKLILNADLSIDGNVITLRAGRRSRHSARERRQYIVNPHTEVGR